MQQQQPQAGGQPGMPQQAAQGLSPQQLQQMQTMARQAMSLLLEDTTMDMIVAKARQGDPREVISDLVVDVLARLHEAATGAGQQVEMVTIMVTGIQIIGTLSEMLVAADIVTEENLPGFVAATCKMAVDKHNASVQQQGGEQPQAQPQGGV